MNNLYIKGDRLHFMDYLYRSIKSTIGKESLIQIEQNASDVYRDLSNFMFAYEVIEESDNDLMYMLYGVYGE